MDDLTPVTRTERLFDGEDLTPTNREEMFIKRIYDKTQAIPEPVNRKEYFLKKAGEAGGDVTVVPLSVTANGTYSEAGKAYSPVTVEVEPPPHSYQLKSITTPTSLATFNASAMPMPSLKVSVEAKQEGSGTPSPENVRPISGWDAANVSDVGKNLLKVTATTTTSQGVTFTVNDDGSITCSGTATGVAQLLIAYEMPITSKFGTVTLSGLANTSNIVWNYIEGFDENDVELFADTRVSTSDKTFDLSQYPTLSKINISIKRYQNGAVSGTIYPQLEIGETATAFEPYNGSTTTISLPQTVYGGELDVVNGTSGNKLTHQFETISGGITRTDSSGYLFVVKDLDVPNIADYDTVTPYIISNYLTPYSVNDLRANAVFGFTQYNKRLYIRLGDEITTVADANAYLASNNLQIKYELATPTTFTTQPTPIKSLNGQNNLSVDCGEVIEGEYFIELGGE